jgi:hypothetical protein
LPATSTSVVLFWIMKQLGSLPGRIFSRVIVTLPRPAISRSPTARRQSATEGVPGGQNSRSRRHFSVMVVSSWRVSDDCFGADGATETSPRASATTTNVAAICRLIRAPPAPQRLTTNR